MMRYCLFILFLLTYLGTAQHTLIEVVKIQGNKRTKSALLKKMIYSQPKKILDSLVLEDDLIRLKKLTSISQAYYQVLLTQKANYKVIFMVEENVTLIPFAHLFTSSNDEFAFRIGIQEFNLLGRNITLGSFYQHDIFNSIGCHFRAPYLLGPKLGLSLSYYDFATQEPVFFEHNSAEYQYSNVGFEVLGLYQFDLKNRIELGFNLFNEDYQYLFGGVRSDVPQSLHVDKHLIKLIYNYDNVKYHYQYLSGFKSSLNVESVGSSLHNFSDFLIGFNDFIFYKRIGFFGNWANRLRIGLATNTTTPFAPFSLDNNINIRGVGNTIDRGTGTIVLNTEYRYTLIDKDWFVVQSTVFIDAGSWRNPGGKFDDFIEYDNIRIYPGVGIRLIHKKIFNAIFRIDYGYGISKNAAKGIVFGIGQYF